MEGFLASFSTEKNIYSNFQADDYPNDSGI